jgi:hypothetical protein
MAFVLRRFFNLLWFRWVGDKYFNCPSELLVKSPSLWACFHPPYPLFPWYLQSKEFKKKSSMKCWNSAFNAQSLRVIIVVVQVGAVKIYVEAVEALRKKGKTGWNMKLSLPPKLVEKLVWVPVISFGIIFILSYVFDALLCWNWPFSPPNCVA